MEELSRPSSAPRPDNALAEARATLVSMAKGRFGRITPQRIVEHVLRMTDGADWPVRKAALAALERRQGFAARDGVRVAQRPSGKSVIGIYKTARSKRGGGTNSRSYETALTSVEPLRMWTGKPHLPRRPGPARLREPRHAGQGSSAARPPPTRP
jgi:hypothetical protein